MVRSLSYYVRHCDNLHPTRICCSDVQISSITIKAELYEKTVSAHRYGKLI
jgi:hypothetical protein